MNEMKVAIVELPPMKVVSFHGFGQGPEDIALAAMQDWASIHQYFDRDNARCFGFNNPDPTPGSPNYGYEVWLPIQQQDEINDANVKQFTGGTYAMAHCEGEMQNAGEFIPSAWSKLMKWLENSSYQMGKHQWLEEQLADDGLTLPEMGKTGKLSLNMYLPVKKG